MRPSHSNDNRSSWLTRKAFLIKAEDTRGGSGAPEKGAPPLIEAVMVGVEGPSRISFVRPGIVPQSE